MLSRRLGRRGNRDTGYTTRTRAALYSLKSTLPAGSMEAGSGAFRQHGCLQGDPALKGNEVELERTFFAKSKVTLFRTLTLSERER